MNNRAEMLLQLIADELRYARLTREGRLDYPAAQKHMEDELEALRARIGRHDEADRKPQPGIIERMSMEVED